MEDKRRHDANIGILNGKNTPINYIFFAYMYINLIFCMFIKKPNKGFSTFKTNSKVP